MDVPGPRSLWRACVAALALVSVAQAAVAGGDGEQLFRDGHYDRALKAWEAEASKGDPDAAWRLAAALNDGVVVELGAGTGAVTRALLSAGVPDDKLIAVELDAQMAQFLRSAHPNVTVVEGCALGLRQLLPPSAIGRIGSVVCGIPASLMPIERQRELVSVMLSLIPAGRPFHMYSYRLSSPLPARTLGLVGKRLDFTLSNFPPASVWAYRADGRGREQAAAGRSEADPET